MHLLLVAPLQDEVDALAQSFTARHYTAVPSQLGRLAVTTFPALQVTLARGGHGKAQFALQTQHLLDARQDLAGVICVGAAGALTNQLAVGDVVVATSTVEHDYQIKFVQRPLPRFAVAPKLLSSLQQVPVASLPFALHYGTIASGDEDIVDHTRAQELQQATGSLAVAWEGAGGARACAFNTIPFMELRGVTDTADHDAPGDFETNLGIAMENVAALIARWRA